MCCIHLHTSPSCYFSLLMSGTIKLFVCFFLAVDFKHALIPCYAKNDVSLSGLAAGSTNDNFTIA